MAYTANVLQLGAGSWTGDDIDLGEAADFDSLIEELRELGSEAETLLLLLEEDDEYVAIVRIVGEREPLAFISDRRALDGGSLAARLLGDELAVEVDKVEDEDADEESARPEVELAGDANLLADLGVDETSLVALCGAKGMLPADVIFEVCERIGCGPVLEQLRGV